MNYVWLPDQRWEVFKQLKLIKPCYNDATVLLLFLWSPQMCLLPSSSPMSWFPALPVSSFLQEDITVLGHAGNMWAHQTQCAARWWEAMAWEGSPVAEWHWGAPNHLQLTTAHMGRQIGTWGCGLGGETQRQHILLLARDCESRNNCGWPRLESSVLPTPALVLFLERCCANKVTVSCCPVAPSSTCPFPDSFVFLITRPGNYLVCNSF